MILSILLSDGSTSVLSDLPKRQYYRIRADWEFGEVRSEVPCPGIVNFWGRNERALQHNSMSKDWQMFWYSLNQSGNTDIDLKCWNVYSNSKSFITDKTGTDEFQNFPAMKNLYEQPAKIETKGCILNVVCIIDEPIKIWGGLYARIETLDITAPPPLGISYSTHPHLIHQANNLTYSPDGKGGFIVRPFDHFIRRGINRPVYFPVTSKGAVYYPMAYLEKLPFGITPSNPYNPVIL